ncbi:MAG: DUF6288 domain-containing protein [Pirellulales bacterium]|nr:DUF6288 domain-containing protein [Pirellulales bacterium]
MTARIRLLQLFSLLVVCLPSTLPAQVDYGQDSPWNQRAESGPDAKVPGWFYNLGITGLRAQLVAAEPKALLIKYVFPRSPADGHVQVGDLVIGAGGKMFQEQHRNGYGEEVFGAHGPISELAQVLEECQSADHEGKLPLTLRRGMDVVEVELEVGRKYGTYAPTFPDKCKKSDLLLAELLQYLADHQRKNGSFGDPVNDTFAPLALLASGEAKYLPAVQRNVKYHCGVTRAEDLSLINWSYMSAAIVLSEYYLATGEKWVLPELQKVHDLMAKSQYLRMSQINPKAKQSHPDDYPKGPKDAHGGWGHNPGFEGYGPIAMLTGQGAMAYSLMHRCGITIDRQNHDAAYDFLQRGTGKNGYVWYGDKQGGGPNNWADMGRTGAAGIANFLSPYEDGAYQERALSHAKVIGAHPQSFPDTHGSPMMGMAYAALAASVDADSFRKLMDANRWWFTMAQCADGTFHYQPNRDNSYYGSDSRMIASSVTAFIFTIPKRSLVMTGKETAATPPRGEKPAARKPLKVFILAGQSNMQGHASVSTFDSMADDPRTAPLLMEMRDKEGKPKVCEKVWISSVGCQGDAYTDLTERMGKLTAGYGAPEDKIGPEFTFGITMEKLLDEPILIIKTSWGGRSLHTDFRPPSGGPFVLAKETQELWDMNPMGAHGIPKAEERPKFWAEKAAATGVYYREMIAHVRKVLQDIKRVVPDYDETQGYELAGFIWFQGFNDLVDGGVYPNQNKAGGYDLYADLLGHFIRDVRKDLSAPKLPFVIGVMGIDGLKGDKKEGEMKQFRDAQRKVAAIEEFQGNVVAVETAPFWDDELEALQVRMEQSWPKVDAKVAEQIKQDPNAESWENKMKLMAENFSPEEWQRLKGVSNGGYHYLGAAKILAPIGKAFAEALLEIKAVK